MKIFLIGLPGSGKTTLGKLLAENLGIDFIDLDAEIEKQENKSVREIFVEKTENYFRQVESFTLKRLCSIKPDFVMATGGGAPCFFNNIDEMNNAGLAIFLNVPISELTKRLMKTNLKDRPLFGAANEDQLFEKLNHLHKQRITFYNQARFKFESTTITTPEILDKIKDYTQR